MHRILFASLALSGFLWVEGCTENTKPASATSDTSAAARTASAKSHAECLVCKHENDLACVDIDVDDKTGLAEVRRSSAIPISTGESEFTRHDFREIAELRGADVLQPDLAIAGGLTEGVRIGAIAAAYNLRLAPHLWSGAPAFAAGVALAASQTTGFILEYSLGANPLLHELVAEKFPVVDGYVAIPDRPGLGITVDESFVRRYAHE